MVNDRLVPRNLSYASLFHTDPMRAENWLFHQGATACKGGWSHWKNLSEAPRTDRLTPTVFQEHINEAVSFHCSTGDRGAHDMHSSAVICFFLKCLRLHLHKFLSPCVGKFVNRALCATSQRSVFAGRKQSPGEINCWKLLERKFRTDSEID